MPPIKTKARKNHLYALRRIRGYRQKHLTFLLGQRSAQMVSRYESGAVLPSLGTALLLEIILGARLSEIYPDLYSELATLASQREDQLPSVLGRAICRRVCDQDNCSHDNSGKGGGGSARLPPS